MYWFRKECHKSRGGTGGRATHSWLFNAKHGLGSDQCFLGGARGIDLRPIDVAKVEIFLLVRNDCVGIRSIVRTTANAGEAGLAGGGEGEGPEARGIAFWVAAPRREVGRRTRYEGPRAGSHDLTRVARCPC